MQAQKASAPASSSKKHVVSATQKQACWKEGSVVDRIDKRISSVIFKIRLWEPLEFLLSIPGVWFGIPAFAQVLGPIFISLAEAKLKHDTLSAALDSSVVCVSVIIGALFFIGWSLALYQGNGRWEDEYGGKNGVIHAYGGSCGKAGMVLLLIVPPHCAIALFYWIKGWMGSEDMHATQNFFNTAVLYGASFHTVILTIVIIKGISRRQRPVMWFRPHGADRHAKGSFLRSFRAFPQISAMLRHPRTSHGAFPSGDVACSAVFFVLLSVVICQEEGGYPCWVFAFVFVLLSAIGRMYFLAHHFLDVTVGACVGTLVSWLTITAFEKYVPKGYEWGSFALLQLVCLQCFAVLRRRGENH